MQNRIKVKQSEMRDTGRYYLIMTEKGTVLGDWRVTNNINTLKVGEEYAIEWEYGGDKGQYKNIKFAFPIEETSKILEEI